MSKSKSRFKELYQTEDPWKFNNTLNDCVRRDFFLTYVSEAFANNTIQTVLDTGCGIGYITSDLAKQYPVVDDISENATRYAI